MTHSFPPRRSADLAVNVVGVRAAARTGVFLAIAKVLPLLMFVGIGAMYVDMSLVTPLAGPIPLDDLGRAALLLLFAYRSEEHTSELQSLMRISYAVFCLKKKNTKTPH